LSLAGHEHRGVKAAKMNKSHQAPHHLPHCTAPLIVAAAHTKRSATVPPANLLVNASAPARKNDVRLKFIERPQNRSPIWLAAPLVPALDPHEVRFVKWRVGSSLLVHYQDLRSPRAQLQQGAIQIA